MKILFIFKAFLLTSLLTFSSLKSLIPCIEVRKRGNQTLILLHDYHVITYAGELYAKKLANEKLISLKDEILNVELNQPAQIIKSINDSKISKDEFIVFNEVIADEYKEFSSPWLKWLNTYQPISNFRNCIGTFNYLLRQNNLPKKNLDYRTLIKQKLERVLREIKSHKSPKDKLNKYYKQIVLDVEKIVNRSILLSGNISLAKLSELLNAILLKNIETCKSKIIFAHFGSEHLKSISAFLEEIGFKKIDQTGNLENAEHFFDKFLTSKKGEEFLQNLDKDFDFFTKNKDKILNEMKNEYLINCFNLGKQLDIYNFLMKHLAPEKQLRSKL